MRQIRPVIAVTLFCTLGVLVLLLCSSARAVDARQSPQALPDFVAILVDVASQKPVPSARLILAVKKEGRPECSIDTSLTGVSNDSGELRIPNVKPGEYVVFYNVSRHIHATLNGKVVNYDPVTPGVRHSSPTGKTVTTASTYMTNITAGFARIAASLGCGGLFQLKGSTVSAVDGNLVLDGFYYADCVDLAMFNSGGNLLAVRVPSNEPGPVTIKINTDIGTLGSKKPN